MKSLIAQAVVMALVASGGVALANANQQPAQQLYPSAVYETLPAGTQGDSLGELLGRQVEQTQQTTQGDGMSQSINLQLEMNQSTIVEVTDAPEPEAEPEPDPEPPTVDDPAPPSEETEPPIAVETTTTP